MQNSQQQQALAQDSSKKFNALYGQIQPFYQDEMKNGLPFFNNLTDYNSGTSAQAFAPARASVLRRTSSMGYLPSGFKAGALADVDSAQAHQFDSGLIDAQYQNWLAKQQGAQGTAGLYQATNPAAFYGGSTSAASTATSPLQGQRSPWASVLGGAAAGAASAIPF